MLLHGVYFTLKDRSPAARKALVDGCRKHLTGHPGEVFFSCGTRREDHKRDVNVLDFDVGLFIAFKDKASHDLYQDAPRHHDFVNTFSPGWEKVRVFDSEGEGSTQP
jgi:hypothetical protein